MTRNNQQSFHVLTIFEHHTTYNVRNGLATFSWGVGWMRGKIGGLRDVVPPESLQSRYLPTRQFFIRKQTVQWDLVVLPHSRGLGVLRDEFRWLKWARTMKSWWIHGDCDHVHGICPMFVMPVNTLFEDISMYPHDTKNRPMSCHNLRLPPWHNIHRICIRVQLEEHLWIQSGGVHQLYCSFFYLTHRARWLFGNEGTFAESRSTCKFVHYSR